MPSYRKAEGLLQERIAGRQVLVDRKGGKIVIDPFILSLLEDADGKEINEIIEFFRDSPYSEIQIRFVLACLAEAGLLLREGETNKGVGSLTVHGELISIVLVSHNSLDWLKLCLPSLEAQTYSPIEVIIVDNASQDGTATFIKNNYPQLTLVELKDLVPFARAINMGIQRSSGEYFLLLNPDVVLEPDAVAHLYLTAAERPDSAAVAAKLRLLHLPRFLNGVGNSIGGSGWGTDSGLGYLDLGQFDRFDELPSACFAATLIPRSAWEVVGRIDERYPMYYEDIDWCYRARAMGRTIYLAPQAVVYHAFSGHQAESDGQGGLSPRKREHVVYGRVRFTLKMLRSGYLLRFLLGYLIEDFMHILVALISVRWKTLNAYLSGWRNVVTDIRNILRERRAIQTQRNIDDRSLFALQKEIPMPLIWHGMPELTLDVILHFYLPWFLTAKTRPLPELQGDLLEDVANPVKGIGSVMKRYRALMRHEGWKGFKHRTLRQLQWKLRQL